MFAEEEEDGDGVAEDAAAADDELQDPLQQEAQQLQQHKLLLRRLADQYISHWSCHRNFASPTVIAVHPNIQWPLYI